MTTIPEQIAALCQPESERECGNCGHAAPHDCGSVSLWCGARGCRCSEPLRVIADLLREIDILEADR